MPRTFRDRLAVERRLRHWPHPTVGVFDRSAATRLPVRGANGDRNQPRRLTIIPRRAFVLYQFARRLRAGIGCARKTVNQSGFSMRAVPCRPASAIPSGLRRSVSRARRTAAWRSVVLRSEYAEPITISYQVPTVPRRPVRHDWCWDMNRSGVSRLPRPIVVWFRAI